MANLSLVGQVPCKIDHRIQITATKISISGDRPVTVKYGPLGAIGSARGFEKVTGSMTLAVPDSGLEPDFLGSMERPGGFALTFPIGQERHLIVGALRSKRGFTNTPESGDTEFSFDFTATDWVRVA